jgi:hypothetical protein
METSKEHRETSYQHYQFSSSIDEAISLIQGESPAVLTLVNECFEASLRLFVEEFNLGGGDGAGLVQKFVLGKKFHSNKGASRLKQSYTTHPDDTPQMREKAREWLKNDFVFYDAVVEQFKLMMAASVNRSGGNGMYFDSCKYYNSSSPK